MGGTEVDVVIIGARVAGSLLATYLGRAGMTVLLVDRASFPSPACSTHFFRGAGLLSVLDELDLLDDVLATGAPPLVRQWTTVGTDGVAMEAGPQAPGSVGYCLSVQRETLDALLVERAAATPGVALRLGTRAVGLVRDDDRVTGVVLEGPEGDALETRAGLVVGADGKGSWLAREVGAPDEVSEPGHRAIYYRYVEGWTAPDGSHRLDAAEFSLVGDEISYAFPSDAGRTCVVVSVNLDTYAAMRSSLKAGFDARLEAHGAFTDRYSRATPATRVLGAGPARNRVRVAAGPGWALVGDAGQYQDPWTGVGMDLASLGARALATEISAWVEHRDDDQLSARWAAARDALGRDSWVQAAVGARDLTPAV